MAHFSKNKYYTAKGEARINSYFISVGKKILADAGFNEDDVFKVYAEDGKIIVEKIKQEEVKET